jgi:hypothetical protein
LKNPSGKLSIVPVKQQLRRRVFTFALMALFFVPEIPGIDTSEKQ